MIKNISYIFLMIVILRGPQLVHAGDIDIRIKNRGNTNIYVAVAKVGGLLEATHVEGWYSISPSFWMEPIIVSGLSGYTYYLAFAIKNDNGDFGQVSYFPTESRSISHANRYYAVSAESFERRGSDGSMQTPPQGYVTVPFTVKIDAGSYGDHDVTVEVRPKSGDQFSKVLSYSKRTQEMGRYVNNRFYSLDTAIGKFVLNQATIYCVKKSIWGSEVFLQGKGGAYTLAGLKKRGLKPTHNWWLNLNNNRQLICSRNINSSSKNSSTESNCLEFGRVVFENMDFSFYSPERLGGKPIKDFYCSWDYE